MNQRDFRKLRGLTQREFARLLGVHEQTVWRYENIGRAPERPVMLRILAISDGIIDADSYYNEPSQTERTELQTCETIQ